MKKIFITIVVGTRPEAIKFAPIIIEMKKNKNIKLRIVLTGQHTEMVNQVFNFFEIKADTNLNIMNKKQTLTYILKEAIIGLEEELVNHKPNIVLVQGDTTTALAGALAAFHNKISLGHVEAGLRTCDLENPFPEEANRRLISQVAKLHFAPTKRSVENLYKSDVLGKIFLTGNSVIDALKIVIKKKIEFPLKDIDKDSKKIILTTIHRRENWGENLKEISHAILEILEENPCLILVLPLHKNDTVRKPLIEILNSHKRVYLIEPLNYADLISIMNESYLILTDSGGIQEEAPSLGKPVLVLRETTERPEAIESGTAKLIGTKKENIVKEVNILINNSELYKNMSQSINPFGDGNTSKRILNACIEYVNNDKF